MLQVFLHEFSLVKPYRKPRLKFLDEVRHRHRRHVLGGRRNQLQRLRAVFFLQLRKNLRGELAVRAISQDERYHHDLALILARVNLAAVIQADGEIGGRARDGRANPETRSQQEDRPEFSDQHATQSTAGSRNPSRLRTTAPSSRSTK